MQIAALDTLACPIDRLPLAAQPGGRGGYRCERGPTYDVARDGHVNLLLVQHKSSRNPGDGKAMVAARRRVHAAGIYAPVADKLFEIVRGLAAAPRQASAPAALRIVDAGCGEGYYLRRLAEQAAASPDEATLHLAGVDISKWAIEAAARRSDPISWVVANNRYMPFTDGSVDLIVSMFGFPVWDGFKPVQAPGGRVLLADPGPDHLIELREVIYPTVKRGEPPSLKAATAAGYRVEQVVALRYTSDIAQASLLQDLVAMTPHASRMPLAGREALARLERLDVTFDVTLRLLQLAHEAAASAVPEITV